MTASPDTPDPPPEEPDMPPEEVVEARAEDLLPEERAAGSANPIAQAEAILEESEERTLDPVAEEHRTSEDTVDPQA
jgi:hypothetical protein